MPAAQRLAAISRQVDGTCGSTGSSTLGQTFVAAQADPIAGRATPQGTAHFLGARAIGLPPSTLGSSDLHVSPIGFGCHRLEDTQEQRNALEVAIKCGCNVLDVAPNYSDGAAESAVGTVLRQLIDEGQARREELVVCTKVGNIVGSALQRAAKRDLNGLSKVREDVWHCLDPAWIEEELSASLERLQLTCIDVVFLHCPEFASKAAGVNMDEVNRRIQKAALHLESEVSKGRVAWYGLSAAFYPLRPSDPEHLLLGQVLPLLPPGHHFRVLQFPLNFAEPQALLQGHTQRNPQGAAVDRERGLLELPLVELARKHGLGILTNRPLDGLYGELRGVLRFASDAPMNSEMQDEDLDELEAKLTAICSPGLGDVEEPVTGELAAKTVKVLASLEAVDTVLVGMHRVPHVAGIARLLGTTPPIAASAALDAVKAANNSISMWFCMAAADHGTAKDWRLPART